MKIIANFFTNPLVVPAYIYLAAYGFVWIIAFILARLFMNQIGIERATTRAWRIAIIAHVLGGTGLMVWICTQAIPRVPEWWHVPFYLILYVLIVIVDICLLVSLPRQRVERGTPVKSPGKSRNPKKS